MRKFGYGLTLSLLLSSVAHATTPAEPQGFLKDLGAEHVGVFLGLHAFKLPGNDVLFLQGSDGKVIGGYGFDASGNDATNPYTGAGTETVFDTFDLAAPSGGADGSVKPPVVQLPEPRANTAIGTLPDLATQSTSPVSSIVEAISGSGVATQAYTELMALAQEAVKDLPEERKAKMLADLMLQMDGAKSVAEFNLAIIEWNEKLVGKPVISEEDRALMRSGIMPEQGAADAATAPAPAVPESPLSHTHNEMKAPTVGALTPDQIAAVTGTPAPQQPAAAFEAPAPTTVDADLLMQAITERAFTIDFGAADAPEIYMFLDPACPYCARAFKAMVPEIQAGTYKAKIMLVPMISERSVQLVAGILASDNPGKALLEHEMAYADRGTSALKAGDFKSIDATLADGVRLNMDIISAGGITSVPFFAWKGEDGPKFMAGADAVADINNIFKGK